MANDRAFDWEGSSLDELVALLSEPALSARILVLRPTDDGHAPWGEVHLVAGGIAETIAGVLRGDEAMERLRAIPNAAFKVEPRLPDPATGALEPAGAEEGTLVERPLLGLMRYCEDYALTCALEVWRGEAHASLAYRRGELVKTLVDGSDAAERLPEVMGWTTGSFRIVMPTVVLPRPLRSARKLTERIEAVPIDRPLAVETMRAPLPAAAPSGAEEAGRRPTVVTQRENPRIPQRSTLPGFTPWPSCGQTTRAPRSPSAPRCGAKALP